MESGDKKTNRVAEQLRRIGEISPAGCCLPDSSTEISMTLLLTASANKADQTAEPLLLSLCGSRDHSWQLCSEGEYSCGSSQQDDIRLNVSGIDSGHCRIVYRGGQLHVRKGRGRIWVHELPVATEARICEGDVVSLGGVSLRFEGVVTAWVRSGRRIDLNPSPETLESATPVVQFIGNSHISFGRLASLFAATQPSPAANTATEQIPTVKTETDTALLRREQEVRRSETAVSRILEELEQTRKKQLDRQNRLHERETALQARQHTLDAVANDISTTQRAVEMQRHQLNERQTQLESKEQELVVLQQAFSARKQEFDAQQQEFNDLLERHTVDTASHHRRQQELNATEQRLAERKRQLDARELELAALQTAFTAQQREFGSLREQLTIATASHVRRQQELSRTEQQLTEQQAQLDAREQELVALQTAFAAQQQEFSSLREQLTAASTSHTSRQQELSRTEQQLAERQAQLDAREQELVAFQTAFAAQQQEFSSLREQLTAASTSHTSRQQELSRTEQQLAERQVRLDAREQELVALQTAFAAQQQEFSSLREQLTAASTSHTSRQQELSRLQHELATERQTLSSRLLELSAHELRLQARECSLAERETTRQNVQQRVQPDQLEAVHRAAESSEHSSEIARLQDRLTDAENGLREREKLIREMYSRLSAQASQNPPEKPAIIEPVPSTLAPCPAPIDHSDIQGSSEAAREFFSAPQFPETSEPVSKLDSFTEPAASEDPADVWTETDPYEGTSGEPHSPTSADDILMYRPGGLLSEELISLLEPSPAPRLSSPPGDGDRFWGTSPSGGLPFGERNLGDPSDPPQGGGDFDSNNSDDQQKPMMYLEDPTDAEFENRDEENGTELVSALAPAEEAARSYVSQLVTTQSNRRNPPPQPPQTGRSSDSLYADRIVHQLRHNREKPRASVPRPSVSYIEQFLSGKRKLWESDADVAEEGVAAEPAQVQQTDSPATNETRQKIDVSRIRREMDSFREVASQVANQAVVSHNLRKSRGGLLPRAGLVSIFMVSTVLLARGPMELGRVYPPILWGNIALLFLASLELARKMTQVIWMSLTAPRVTVSEPRATVTSDLTDKPAASEPDGSEPEEPIF